MTNTVPMRETPDHASARVITLDEAAEMLCCSYSTALRLVTDGELRAFRVRARGPKARQSALGVRRVADEHGGVRGVHGAGLRGSGADFQISRDQLMGEYSPYARYQPPYATVPWGS